MLASRHVRVDGVETHLLEAGPPEAPVLMLLHDGAFGTDARIAWSTLADDLEGSFRIVAPDLPGYGRTDKVLRFDVDPMLQRIRHIAALCEQTGIDDATFVGASFGGGMVLRGAAAGLLPMMSRGVSIGGTGGLFFTPRMAEVQEFEPSLEASARLWAVLAPSVPEELVQARYENSLLPGHWETLMAARLRNPSLQPPPPWADAFRAALAGISTPILLVAGADDPLLESGWHEELGRLIPSATTLLVPGARHLPHLTEPGDVAAAIAGFARADR